MVFIRGAYSTEYRRVVPCVRRAEPVQETDCFHARFVIVGACRTPLLRSAHRYCNDFVQGERSDGLSQDRRRMPDMACCLCHARVVEQLGRFHLGERPRFGRRGWKAWVAQVHGMVGTAGCPGPTPRRPTSMPHYDQVESVEYFTQHNVSTGVQTSGNCSGVT